MRNTQRWRNQWTSALKSQLSLETLFPPVASLWRAISPSFPRPKILRIGKHRKGLKLFTAGYVCIRDMTPCKQTPRDKLHNHSTYLCAYPFFTREEDFPDRLLSLYEPDWSVSGFLGQSRFLRLILMWCDVMRCYPLLFYSSFRCASLSVARLPRLLWRTSLLNTTFTRTVVNWKSCIFLLKHNVIAYLFVSLNTHYIRIDFSEHTVLSK